MSRRIAYRVSGKQVTVGYLDGNTLRRRVHIMRKSQAYGLQPEVLDLLRKEGCRYIIHEVIDDIYGQRIKEGDLLTSRIEDWDCCDFTRDFGYGTQKFLSASSMEIQMRRRSLA